MRTDRPGPRTSTVPRLCSALIAAASGAVLGMAALAPACAQTAQPKQTAQADPPPAADGDLFRLPDAATVFAPPTRDRRGPGRFRRVKPAQQGGGPTTFGQITVYGNPPGYGAGAAVIETPAQTLVPPIQTPTRRKPVVEEDPYAPTGIRAGSFTIYPGVELMGGIDTNPAHVPNGKDSFLYMISPDLKVRSDWERNQLNADIKSSYIGYAQTFGTNADGSISGVPNSLNRPSLDSKIDGRLDVTSRSHLDMEGRLLVGTDNPGSPNIQAGLASLPLVTTTGATLGYTQGFNRIELTAKGTFDRSVWEASRLTDGSTSGNADRNFDQYGGSLRGSYELKPGLNPFIEVGADTRIHDLAFDRNGEQRDSNGIDAKIGTTFEFTRKLTGELSVGYLARNYKDPNLNSIGGLTTDASLIFTATPLTTFTATAKSTVNEVILPGVSGDFSHDYSLQIDHAFRRWLLATAQLGYGTDNYVGLNRFDQRWFASFTLIYKLSQIGRA